MQGAAAHLATVQDHLLEGPLRYLLAAACRAGLVVVADAALSAARERGAPRKAETWVHVLRLRVSTGTGSLNHDSNPRLNPTQTPKLTLSVYLSPTCDPVERSQRLHIVT